MKSKTHCRRLALILVLLTPLVGVAQTTEFTYQGKLTDGALPGNTTYDFEFRLFAVVSGGAAIATQTRLAVPVSDGIFTVSLDFGGQFNGANRWLEIAVKPAGSPNPLTVLAPRQPLTSAPHAIRSLSAEKADIATNSLQLGGVTASQYVLTTDGRLTDARAPLANSSNYVQNTTAPQSSSNFNITGNGTAGGTLSASTINATTQFNLGGNRILSNAGTNNLFGGVGAGQSNTTGSANAFFGRNAGSANTAGQSNAFFGDSAGASNNSGDQNSFFGFFGGLGNTTGVRNSYFGYRAGQQSTVDNDNSFFGYRAGFANTANNNAFFGASAGEANTTGSSNSFFGYNAGVANITATANSFFGTYSGEGNTTGYWNAFFGYRAGKNNTKGAENTFVGYFAGANNITGDFNTAIGASSEFAFADLNHATAIGAEARVNTSDTIALGRSDGSDKVVIYGLGTAGSTDVCRNASNQLSTCSSSLRYKNNIKRFNGGLNLVNHLRPITFFWNEGGRRDLGFAAEEVEKLEPLLVNYNDKGEIEGVKYRQLTAVLVNAVNQQQREIEVQRELNVSLQEQVAGQNQLIEQLQRQVQRQQQVLDALVEKALPRNSKLRSTREKY